jgi:hypothetical protein
MGLYALNLSVPDKRNNRRARRNSVFVFACVVRRQTNVRKKRSQFKRFQSIVMARAILRGTKKV